MPTKPFSYLNHLSYRDQLHFAFRQSNYLKPLLIVDEYKYEIPFYKYNWVNYCLNLPVKYRRNKYFFKKILNYAYPYMFKIKNTSSLSIRDRMLNKTQKIFKELGISKGIVIKTNYIDFGEGIRERKDLNELIRENIFDLQYRGIVDWVNINKLWKMHYDKIADYSDALIALASLEIYLKAKKY